MQEGKGKPWGRLIRQSRLFIVVWLLAGCATVKPPLDRALLTDKRGDGRNIVASAPYVVGCPDVLDVSVAARTDLSGLREIGPDGCIDLSNIGRLRVEGLSVTEVARVVAEVVEVAPADVQVRVAQCNSRQIFVIGQVVGRQRAVAYQGPETVLDLLQRVGGITPGAAPDEVYVVRSRVAEGKRPEVFRVDLHAILVQQDTRTNIPLQPLDQVFVGETRQSIFEKCIPPWLRPFYETVCGMRPPLSGDHKKGSRTVG